MAAAPCPSLEEAQKQLPAVLKHLTQISLESMADLAPDDGTRDEIMVQHFQRVSALCAQIQLDADRMNPRWNKTYGLGGTYWEGALDDERNRGGLPYYCPNGWVRFALNVCPDEEFEARYNGWGYLYHGTKGRFVGSILTSGFRASQGLCFCGKEDFAVYMSPSVEYCSHPRYGSIEFNPETRMWMQVVLQCRVKPTAVWKVERETLYCREFGKSIDQNVDNSQMEWLFKPNHTDEITGHMFIKDAIVCTGIMIRVTREHPFDLDYWWTGDDKYEKRWQMRKFKVDPTQGRVVDRSWTKYTKTSMMTFSFTGQPWGDDFELHQHGRDIVGPCWMAPAPFANGSMRFAWYLQTAKGLYVVKAYNEENVRHIQEGLGISLTDAILKDAATYLVARHLAGLYYQALPCAKSFWNWRFDFAEPFAFLLGGTWYFGERFLPGDFLKWNTNTGENNESPEAAHSHLDSVAGFFSHYTYAVSKGRIMVVDIQGFTTKNPPSITFTDPQIHTRSFGSTTDDRKRDVLYQRFSVGNLGKTGMMRFFANHTCNEVCQIFDLSHPLDESGSLGSARR